MDTERLCPGVGAGKCGKLLSRAGTVPATAAEGPSGVMGRSPETREKVRIDESHYSCLFFAM